MSKTMYPISFEVAGDFAMFADPATGSESVSYPIPPPTACLGIINSIKALIANQRAVCKISIVAVGICSRPIWVRYSYNSFAVKRKKSLIKLGNAGQIHEHVLESPCFQIFAIAGDSYQPIAHQFQEQLFRRLRRRQTYHPICLGRKEFLITSLGPAITPVYQYSAVLPSFLTGIDYSICPVKATTTTNLHIKDGVVEFVDGAVKVENGILRFADDERHSAVTKLWVRRGDR